MNKYALLQKIAQQQNNRNSGQRRTSNPDLFLNDPEFLRNLIESKLFGNKKNYGKSKDQSSFWNNQEDNSEDKTFKEKVDSWMDQNRYDMFSPGDWGEHE